MSDNKAALRISFLERRLSVTTEAQAASSAAISEQVIAAEIFQTSASVAGYLPFRGEADPMAVLRHAAKSKQTCLPAMREKKLVFRLWKPGDDLAEGQYGVHEPAAGEEIIPQLVLIPLVACDKMGYRLGYGGGYFDRTFAEPQFVPCFRLGLAYDWQVLESLPHAAHDVRLHGVATEESIIYFS